MWYILVWTLILFKGSFSMEKHLPYKNEVGGSIPLCPIYINQWLIKCPVNNNQWLNKWLINKNKWLVNNNQSLNKLPVNNNQWINKWLNLLPNNYN